MTVSLPPLPPLDPATTALVSLDLVRGIVANDCAPHKAAEVVSNTDALARALRARGGLVVYVRVSWGSDGTLFPHPPADFVPPVPESLPEDWNELVADIEVDARDAVVTKYQWGGFYGTDLDLRLRRRGIRTILLGGIATNLGVESTARSAFDRGYAQVFVEDAMTAFDEQSHVDTVTRLFPLIGRVRTTGDVLAALDAG